jgi:hypothetical protein
MAIAAKRNWDIPWSGRAREEAANLNPAFCGELLSRAVSEYSRRKLIVRLSMIRTAKHPGSPTRTKQPFISYFGFSTTIVSP